ncbi:unnamed protein product [Acanthoscelides obtectus]|uniref:Uncharacterized protein n=1 Tax=Acanthoscelides obtectus TaxID=200917 RepID=A0A9P0M4S3_ACAOB|nr:unnamed protein product [Acanthoscelides obtectus]CAK1656491.1 hypothetical protein AOBTE_LOCUS19745 [Acanthoscelides obtectus]
MRVGQLLDFNNNAPLTVRWRFIIGHGCFDNYQKTLRTRDYVNCVYIQRRGGLDHLLECGRWVDYNTTL